MTNTLAPTVQRWFTSLMDSVTNTKSKSESIYEKAERICSDPARVITVRAQGADFWSGIVVGDHGRYIAVAFSQEYMDANGISGGRVGCKGHRGAGRKLCAHALVAEEMRLRGESQ
jgi:hypothetical protein